MKVESLKKILQLAIDNIDAGNCNISEEDMSSVIDIIQRTVNPGEPLSKYQVAQKLGCSEKTIDNMVKSEKLPKGKKLAGLTAKFWFKRDIDKYVQENESNI